MLELAEIFRSAGPAYQQHRGFDARVVEERSADGTAWIKPAQRMIW